VSESHNPFVEAGIAAGIGVRRASGSAGIGRASGSAGIGVRASGSGPGIGGHRGQTDLEFFVE